MPAASARQRVSVLALLQDEGDDDPRVSALALVIVVALAWRPRHRVDEDALSATAWTRMRCPYPAGARTMTTHAWSPSPSLPYSPLPGGRATAWTRNAPAAPPRERGRVVDVVLTLLGQG